MKQKEEKKQAAASYILNFYKEVLTLTEFHSQYLNLLLELEAKYQSIDKAADTEKETIKNAVQNLRYYCTKAYIQYSSISLSLNTERNKDIEEIYTRLKNNYVLERSDVENFVILLNNFLVGDVIKDLIDNSANLVDNAFNNATE